MPNFAPQQKNGMHKCIVALCVMLITCACNNNKVSLQGDKKVEVRDFIEAFPPIELPFVISDTNINSLADSSTINYKVFSNFIPDSLLSPQFTKPASATIHPIGSFKNKDMETYLVAQVENKTKTAVYLFVLNDTLGYSAGLPLVVSSNKTEVVTTATIDKKLGITIYDEWKADNIDYYQRDTYAYNNVGTFTLVLSETNDFNKKQVTEVNPLDTFPKQNKLSGDYYKGKNNMLSLRDGKNEQNYRFYVYFKSTGDEECIGELRGELQMTSATTGVFRETGDPCVIDFTFNKNQVKVKEQGSCGNYRGIKCFFNDTFTRKKESNTSNKK